jgi:hypothetical protein
LNKKRTFFRIRLNFILIEIIICLLGIESKAQNDSMLINEWKEIIQIDTITIYSKGTPFNIDNFMKLVLEDNSLYQSFKNLHSKEYKASHEISVLDKNSRQTEFFSARTTQHVDEYCREVLYTLKNQSKGYFKRSGRHKYYTTEIYDKLFLPQGKTCKLVSSGKDEDVAGIMDTYIQKIKRIVFSPAKKTFIPFIGDQNMIFSPQHRWKYNFKLRRIFLSGIEAYEFSISRKPEIQHEDVLIENMETWFDASDLQIIKRKMIVKKQSLFYDLDIKLDISTKKIEDKYYPSLMKYKGDWSIPFKKREKISFTTFFFY